MEGYGVFREWMLEHTERDVDNFITIQSLAFSFMLKTGCYDNVYQVSGVAQQYITKCVVGGRDVACAKESLNKREYLNIGVRTTWPAPESPKENMIS